MFGIAGTAELSTFCPGTGTWNRLQDGNDVAGDCLKRSLACKCQWLGHEWTLHVCGIAPD